MSPHFYVNSLVLLPPQKWWVARKKSADPFLHTLFPPYVVQVHTMLYQFLCQVWVSQYLNRYNKYIFEKTVPTISGHDLSYVGTDMNFRCVTRKGKWPFHLRPDTNSYVLPSSSKILLPLKVGEYPAAARQWGREPTYAKYSAIYIKRPFKPSYVVKNCCLWTLP